MDFWTGWGERNPEWRRLRELWLKRVGRVKISDPGMYLDPSNPSDSSSIPHLSGDIIAPQHQMQHLPPPSRQWPHQTWGSTSLACSHHAATRKRRESQGLPSLLCSESRLGWGPCPWDSDRPSYEHNLYCLFPSAVLSIQHVKYVLLN